MIIRRISQTAAIMPLLLLVFILVSARGPEPALTASLPILERPARPQELLAYPEDGQPVGVNPPGFCWTPSDTNLTSYVEYLSSRSKSSI